MRGRVSEPCSRYLFNDRIHYLDDRSLLIYQEGVKRYHGIFTIETFESVINAPHTLDRVRQGELEKPDIRHSAMVFPQPEDEPQDTLPVESDKAIADPDIIPFGYFKERREPRVQMICETDMRLHGVQIKGVTRDLSVSGARLFVEGDLSALTGNEIYVSFMGLQREADGVDVYDIPYTVVGLDHQDDGTLLRLQRVKSGKWEQFDKFTERLLKRRDPDSKLDIEDDYQSALAWYYERLYAENSAFIPVFVGKDDASELFVQSVALTQGNQFLSRFFCTSTDNYNFTPLCLPQRLKSLQNGKHLLIAMYRDQGENDRSQRIHSAASDESASDEEFLGFVRHALSCPEHCVVKVMPGSLPLKPVSAAKVNLFSSKLRSLASEQASNLDAQIASLQFVAYMADMTAWAQQWAADQSMQCKADELVWVGSEQRNIKTGEVRNKLEISWRRLNPELIRFGYVERRREHRYLAKTAVSVQLRNETMDGMTQDLSMHGMRILLPGEVDVKQGAMIKVGLTTMQEKRGAIDLMNIPYRIVSFLFNSDGTVLMLERIAGNRDSAMDEFFAELIAKNRHKLPVDTSDVAYAATAGIFEAMQSSNTPAIAFFLGMDRDRGAYMQFLGLPIDGNLLAQNISQGKSQRFGYLFSQKLVKAMYDAVQLLLRQSGTERVARPAFEFELFVYQDASNNEPAGLNVVSEIDSGDTDKWMSIRQQIMTGENWCGLQVVVSAAYAIEDKLFDTLLSGIRNESKHRAIKLSDAVGSVTGCGEIFDITDELARLPVGSENN
jgi:c-di-GMP-binding flagellar brake protein YcgR